MSCKSLLLLIPVALSGCTSDPLYVDGDPDILSTGDAEMPGLGQLSLPVRLEEDEEAEDRATLAAELEVEVPFVRIDEIAISLEWTVINEGDSPAQAEVHINGSNEYFTYIPLNFVVDPEEEPVPPSLLQSVPLQIQAGESVGGVFREDQLREASLDLELMTRGAVNPFAAMLEIHEDLDEIEVEGGTAIPKDAWASLIQLDVSLFSSAPVRLKYAVRVRSKRSPNYLHDEGLSAPTDELTEFAPVEFVPPPPPPDE